jgi:hypothetical protein
MDRDEVAQLALAIEKSIEMRQALQDKLTSDEPVDLVEEWEAIERLDVEIRRSIRKRPPD